MSEIDNMIPILFKIVYQHNLTPRLMCFNEDDNNILIYSLYSHKFEYLSLNSSQIYSIHFSSDESILNVGYSTRYHLFYLSTYRKTNRFVLFRLNEKFKEIEIEEEIKLIDCKDHFINVHIYENIIFYLYLSSSSIVMFGKYDLENSSFISSISFEKKLYDYDEKCPYKIIDFTINNSFIFFLIQLKNKKKSKIFIYDYENMNKLHSFDLIDSIKPLSIISTQK
jgi:WD40 repeat protein